MPDLSIEHHWLCKQNVSFSTHIKGSKGEDYLVELQGRNWYCSCKGFKFRRNCGHIQQAKAKNCRWNGYIDGDDVVEVPVDDDHPNGYACSRCGGEVESQRYGV